MEWGFVLWREKEFRGLQAWEELKGKGAGNVSAARDDAVVDKGDDWFGGVVFGWGVAGGDTESPATGGSVGYCGDGRAAGCGAAGAVRRNGSQQDGWDGHGRRQEQRGRSHA